MLLELASKFYSLSYFDICASSIHIDRFWLMFLCKPGNCSSRKIKGKLLKDHRTTWCLVFFGILVSWLLSWFFVGQIEKVDDLLLVTGIFLGKMSSRLCADTASKSGNFLHGMYAAIIHWTFPPQLSSWLQDDKFGYQISIRVWTFFIHERKRSIWKRLKPDKWLVITLGVIAVGVIQKEEYCLQSCISLVAQFFILIV